MKSHSDAELLHVHAPKHKRINKGVAETIAGVTVQKP